MAAEKHIKFCTMKTIKWFNSYIIIIWFTVSKLSTISAPKIFIVNDNNINQFLSRKK